MAATDDLATMALEDIDISVDSLTTDSPRFLGEIVVESYVNGQYGPQYQVSVRQLDVVPAPGKRDAVHTCWSPISSQRRSIMGMQLLSFNAFATPRPEPEADEKVWKAGRSRLVGARGWFVRRDIVFGRNKATGQDIVGKGKLIAVEKFNPNTDEDLIVNPSAGTPYVYEPSVPEAEGGSGVRSREVELGPELADEVAAWLSGKTEDEASTASVRAKKDFPFNDDVKRGIISGVVIKQLKAAGKIEEGEDGALVAR